MRILFILVSIFASISVWPTETLRTLRESSSPAASCASGTASGKLQTIITEIFPTPITSTPRGGIGSSQIFYPIRAIGEPISRSAVACLSGVPAACRMFSSWVQKLSDADALRLDRDKHSAKPASLATATLTGNMVLRPIAFYTHVLSDAGAASFRDKKTIRDWLVRRSDNFRNFPNLPARALAQNHHASSALTSLIVGLAVGDAKMFGDSISLYKAYIDTMRKDGSFPQQTRRGSSALKYSNRSVAYLIAIAELLKLSSSIDLYTYEQSGATIHTAVSFLLDAISDESFIADYAAENYAPTDFGLDGQSRHFLKEDLGWTAIYIRRFPRQQNATRIEKELAQFLQPRSRPNYDRTLGLIAACMWTRDKHPSK